MASGSTWWNTACIFEAPTPSAASRIEGGTAFSEARVEMMIVGSVISVSTSPPTSGADCGRCANWMNTARPEDAEHDRGHRGEVRDVHLDQVGEPVLRREFLEVDRGGHADRQRQRQHHQHHEERAQHRHADARRLGVVGGVGAGDEGPVEALLMMPGLAPARRRSRCSASRFLSLEVLAGHPALEVAVDPRRGEHLERLVCRPGLRDWRAPRRAPVPRPRPRASCRGPWP
jgi:hypothetical protein